MGVVLLFATALSIFTIIGFPFMVFITQVVLADLWAQVYRAAD